MCKGREGFWSRRRIRSGNEIILENCRRAAARARRMIIRYPMVPGLNDEPGNVKAMIRFVLSLGRVEEIDILPYHQLGVAKYKRLGREYELEGTCQPTEEQIHLVKEQIVSHGFAVRVRG